MEAARGLRRLAFSGVCWVKGTAHKPHLRLYGDIAGKFLAPTNVQSWYLLPKRT